MLSHKSWMASMQINGSPACGASLISPQWIISASHCTVPTNNKDIVIKLGGVDLNNEDEFETFTILKKIEHPDFDVVLMKLSEPSLLSKPIKINNNDNLSEGLVTKAIGWGKLGEQKGGSDILQTVDLPIVSDTECNRAFGSKFNKTTMICAGYKGGQKDACQGDSGGPLFTETQNGDVLIGVTSWGEGCARAGVYGVWTRLSQLNDWIDENIDEEVRFEDAELENTEITANTEDEEVNEETTGYFSLKKVRSVFSLSSIEEQIESIKFRNIIIIILLVFLIMFFRK